VLCCAVLCCAQVDTAKDMVDNCAGMMLALLALATHAGTSGNDSKSGT
jgi:hypothetical protein